MPPNFSTGQRFPSVLQHCWLGERNGTILSCQVCPKVLSGKMEKTWAETWLTQVHTNNSHLNHVLLVDKRLLTTAATDFSIRDTANVCLSTTTDLYDALLPFQCTSDKRAYMIFHLISTMSNDMNWYTRTSPWHVHSTTNVTPAILSCNFVAQLCRMTKVQCATAHTAQCNSVP